MLDFYQICVLIAVIALVVLVAVTVKAILQITRTAEAAEYLLVTTAEKVDQTKSTFDLLESISTFLDSGWYKAVKTGIDFVNRFRGKEEK
jgi:hypothetical protein